MAKKFPAESQPERLGATKDAERFERFLLDTVNLPNPIDYGEEGKLGFARWCNLWGNKMTYRANDGRKSIAPREDLATLAPVVRTTLRRMWSEADTRQRDWYCFRLRDVYSLMVRHLEGWQPDVRWDLRKGRVAQLTDYAVQDAPALSFFEESIVWAQGLSKRMLTCANPDCSLPYFFRTDKGKGQKYRPECANAARRASKLKWWRANRATVSQES